MEHVALSTAAPELHDPGPQGLDPFDDSTVVARGESVQPLRQRDQDRPHQPRAVLWGSRAEHVELLLGGGPLSGPGEGHRQMGCVEEQPLAIQSIAGNGRKGLPALADVDRA